jgi:hypothetical protein
VDEVGTDFVGDLEQPVAGTLDVAPRVLHPLERVAAGVSAPHARPAQRRALVVRERRPHRDERELDGAVGKRVGKLQGVRPHSADGVGRHQDLHADRP